MKTHSLIRFFTGFPIIAALVSVAPQVVADDTDEANVISDRMTKEGCTQILENGIERLIVSAPSARVYHLKAACRVMNGDYAGAYAPMKHAYELEKDPATKRRLKATLQPLLQADMLSKARDDLADERPEDCVSRIKSWFKEGGKHCPSVYVTLTVCEIQAGTSVSGVASARKALSLRCPVDVLPPRDRATMHVALSHAALERKNYIGAEREAKRALSLAEELSVQAEGAQQVLQHLAMMRARNSSPLPEPRVEVVPNIRLYRCSTKCTYRASASPLFDVYVKADGVNDASWQATAKAKASGLCRNEVSAKCEEVR